MPRQFNHVPGYYEITFVHITDPAENLIIEIPVAYINRAGIFIRNNKYFTQMNVKFIEVNRIVWKEMYNRLGWGVEKINRQFDMLDFIYELHKS